MSTVSNYSIGSNISNSMSMISNASTLSSGGIFKKPELQPEIRMASAKDIVGPDMSSLSKTKNKQKRTDLYLKLLREKKKVSNFSELNYKERYQKFSKIK
jgi:hypothetical protein